MRIAIAVLAAAALSSVGIGMLRSLGARGPHKDPPPPTLPPVDVRITYWCEACGTEFLLLRKGSDSPPRHCGEPMKRREEVAHNN